jgi:non-specific serine/threonine protein kinase/serine/threonine-protein kinase
MTETARFARVEALIDEALEQAEAARHDWLLAACEDQPELLADALSLLQAIEQSTGFLESNGSTDPDAQTLSGSTLGGWRLLRLLGHGGSGEVWLAERADARFDQRVAIKRLHYLSVAAVQRFEREQALLARMEHPGIARLIDAGCGSDGQPYMVMEFVEGDTLMAHCERARLALPARLELFDQVCEAVAHAHRHLIVHCDLKPANILVRADGRVALLDFGIARLLGLDAESPATRSLHFTPQYAAPEQLSGGEQSTLTDVYALGLLLHELLCGRSPWGTLTGRAGVAVLQRALAGPPPAPSTQAGSPSLARRLRGDLDAIVGKALRPEPSARYGSVEALREDLQRHRERLPVRARGDAFLYRLQRGLRRYWLAASVALLFAGGLIAGSAAVWHAQQQAERERDVAQMEAMRAKAVRDYIAHMFRDAGQRAGGGAMLTAKQVLDQAALRIEATFSADPETAAPVLHALGELHLYINDYAGAEPLLRRWLEGEAGLADPDSAADVRFALAEAVFRMGQIDDAAQLLHAAQSHWQQASQRHAERLLTSRMLQSQIERQRGEVALGIETLEASLPQRLQRSGEQHFETAALLSNLGAAYIQAGRVPEGIEASRRAMGLWRALQLENGNDALNTLNNLAAAYFRNGDLEQSAAHFEQALTIRRALFGPSAATAALIGNYARVLQRRFEFDSALALIDEAEPMARDHAGRDSPLTLSLMITRAELLLSMSRLQAADSVLLALEAMPQLPPPLLLRALLARSTLLRDRGQVALARARLQTLIELADSMGSPAQALRPEIDALAATLD